MYTLGVDIGSTTSKAVILKDGQEIISTSLIAAGTGTDGPDRVIEAVLAAGSLTLNEITSVYGTGYGRKLLKYANGEMSELSCHAKGVHHLMPEVRTIIDIGGQDAKVLSLGTDGRLAEFLMNDKCAAGTGRFLDVMAGILQLKIEDLEKQAAIAKSTVKISSTCTVFAESEVISQLANGVEIPDLVAGICQSVASRVASLAKRIGVQQTVCMSGGVARNGGVRKAMEQELGIEIIDSPMAQFMGALGASLYAYDKS